MVTPGQTDPQDAFVALGCLVVLGEMAFLAGLLVVLYLAVSRL